MKGEPPGFAPCTLGRGKDGDPATFFAKASGYGYNDMITLPTLTKESILENLSRRFKVRPAARRFVGGDKRALRAIGLGGGRRHERHLRAARLGPARPQVPL